MRQIEESGTHINRRKGQFLKDIRTKMGLTQRQAALKAGISPSSLCKLESGERLQSRNIIELAEVYNIDPKELKYEPPKKKPMTPGEMLKKMFPDTWKEAVIECLNEGGILN